MERIRHDNGLTLYRLESGKEGPHLLVFGAIHGDEVAGTIVLNELLEKIENDTFKLDKGTLTFCPVCNPLAHEKDQRYVDTNLNRMFGEFDKSNCGYETSISEVLMGYIDECDYLLDLHSTHKPGDPVFVFSEAESGPIFEYAKALKVDNIFLDWKVVYHGEDYCTEAYALKQGKIATTLECGYHKDPTTINIAKNALYNILSFLDMHKASEVETITETKTPNIYRFETCVYREDGDVFTSNWGHMDKFKKGDPIYKKGNGDIVHAEKDCIIIMPNKKAQTGDEFYYLGYPDRTLV